MYTRTVAVLMFIMRVLPQESEELIHLIIVSNIIANGVSSIKTDQNTLSASIDPPSHFIPNSFRLIKNKSFPKKHLTFYHPNEGSPFSF